MGESCSLRERSACPGQPRLPGPDTRAPTRHASAPIAHLTPAQVFKAARALAPSVVLLEDPEQVFVSDKTRAAALAPPGGEPPNRIKKQLLAEVRRRAGREAGLGGGVWC